MGYLFVLGFTDDLVKVGHANDPGKRVLSSARFVAGRLNTTLVNRWVSTPTPESKECKQRLIHWACCRGKPVFGHRGVFAGLDFDATVAEAERLIYLGEECSAVLDIMMTDPLPPDSLAYRLRQHALAILTG